MRPTAPPIVAIVLAVVVLTPAARSAGVAGAQAPDSFLPLPAVAGNTPEGSVVFFPLAEAFQRCLPLTSPCPANSSSLVVVPARGRQLSWRPESSDLPEVALAAPPIRAIGGPPPDPGSARYLVPVLETTGAGLVFVARRLEGGRLVAIDPAASGPREGDQAVPVLAGPVLGGAAPSGAAARRVVEAPTIVEARSLAEATPALVVRRAAPSRVVFALRPEAGWRLEGSYVALLDETAIAVIARHEDRVGLAVPVAAVRGSPAEAATTSTGSTGSASPGDAASGRPLRSTESDDGGALSPLLVVGSGVALLVVLAVARHRRKARRR